MMKARLSLIVLPLLVLAGSLAILLAPGTAEAAHERAGYVRSLREANSSAYGPW